jgi:hypothetical protein
MTLHQDAGFGELSGAELGGVTGGGIGVDMKGYALGKAGMKDGEFGNRLGAELGHSMGWLSDDMYYSATGQFDKIGTGPKQRAKSAISGAAAGAAAGALGGGERR